MLMVRSDLERLEKQAGIDMDDDEEVGIIWRCFEDKKTIDFVEVEIEVDYGIEIKLVKIDRPYCPECNSQAKDSPDVYLPSLIEPLPYEYLVSISRHPILKPI